MTLARDGEEVLIEADRLLRVLDYSWRAKKEAQLVICTTEAVVKESARGTIPLGIAEDAGNDETELWGLES